MADLTNAGLDLFHATMPLRLGVDAANLTEFNTDATGRLSLSKALNMPGLRINGQDAFTTTRFGAYGVAPVARPTAYTQPVGEPVDKTLAAYASDAENVAYTGAADGEAKLADLNALRVAYENLRVAHEDLRAFVNAVVDDLQALGLVQ